MHKSQSLHCTPTRPVGGGNGGPSSLLRRLSLRACERSACADLVHATKASCSEPAAAKETPADGLVSLQQQATAASCSVGTGEVIAWIFDRLSSLVACCSIMVCSVCQLLACSAFVQPLLCGKP